MRLAIFLKKLLGLEKPESHFNHVNSWVNSLGGMPYILRKMKEHNLSQVVYSWENKKEGLRIDANQVLEFIDFSELQPLAETCGTDILGAANLVAQFLPVMTARAAAANLTPEPLRHQV